MTLKNLILLSFIFSAIKAQEPSSTVRIGAVLPQDDTGEMNEFLRSSVEEINGENPNRTQIRLHVSYAQDGSLYQAFQKACEMFQYRVITVLGSTFPTLDFGLSSACSNFHVPYLSILPRKTIEDLTGSSARGAFTLSMSPSIEDISGPLIALGQQYEWEKVGLIFHEKSGLLDIGKLAEAFQKYEIRPQIYELKSWDIRRGLKDIETRGISSFIVDIGESYINNFFIQALECGIVNEKSTFVFTSLNILSREREFVNRVQFTGANVLGISLLDKDLSNHLDGDLDIYKALWKDSLRLFSESLDDLAEIETKELNCRDPEVYLQEGYQLIDGMKRVQIKGLSGNVNFDSTSTSRVNQTFYIYQLRPEGYMKKVGKWRKTPISPIQGLMYFDNPMVMKRIRARKRFQLRIGVVMRHGSNTSSEDKLSSYFDELVFENLAEGLTAYKKMDLNISLHFFNQKMNLGQTKRDQRIAKFINRKNLHILLGPFDDVPTPWGNESDKNIDKAPIIRSRAPFLRTNMTLLTLKNREVALGAGMDSTLFWLCVLGLYVISSFLLFGIIRLSPYSRRKYNSNETMTALGDCFWFLVPPGLPASSHKIKTPSSRLFILTYFLFAMEVAFIVFISLIVNVQDISSSTSPLLSRYSNSPQGVRRMSEELIRQGRYAIPEVEWNALSKYFDGCLIEPTLGEEDAIVYRALFPKGSSWEAEFSAILNKLEDDGKLEALKNKWFTYDGVCLNSVYPRVSKQILWITLGVGYLLSLLFALVEFLTYVIHAHDVHNPEKTSRSKIMSSELRKIFDSEDSDVHHRVGESIERSPPVQQRFLTTM